MAQIYLSGVGWGELPKVTGRAAKAYLVGGFTVIIMQGSVQIGLNWSWPTSTELLNLIRLGAATKH